jgi:hypothetical protein
MANAAPITITVPAVLNTPGASASVANLGPYVRTFFYNGSPGDVVLIQGSNDNVNFAAIEKADKPVTLSGSAAAGGANQEKVDDRSLFYRAVLTQGVTGGGVLTVEGEDVGFQPNALTGAFKARNVGPAANVANLAVFTVAGNDGVLNVAGDVVYLYAQTNPVQNGPYVVGGVAAGVAALTRPVWWAAGATIGAGQIVDVAAGTLFSGTQWKAFALAPFIVDAADPLVFPLFVAQRVTLVAGTVNIANVPIRSATSSQIGIRRVTPNVTALTVEYNWSALTPGALGVASLDVEAQIAAGTINNVDVSILNVSITNG